MNKRIYTGIQEDGRLAFLHKKFRKDNPYHLGESSKRQRWDSGWIKAKLAKEQGKESL